jgi:transcriptional regulator with XRE-family HTH domain
VLLSEVNWRKIKLFRKKNNINQKEFSLNINISQANLSEIEKNNSKPSAVTLSTIRKNYQITDSELVTAVYIAESIVNARKRNEYSII